MESKTISFFVHGKPVTQGSLTSFPYMKKGGAGMGVSTPQSAKVIEWRRKVQEGAQEAYPDLLDGITPLFPKGTPVYAYMEFKLLQPKSNKDEYPLNSRTGDLDKYVRCVLDAGTMLESEKKKGVKGNSARFIFEDDSQVKHLVAEKEYVKLEEEEGVYVLFSEDRNYSVTNFT